MGNSTGGGDLETDHFHQHLYFGDNGTSQYTAWVMLGYRDRNIRY